MRKFFGIDQGADALPDETTNNNLRLLLEEKPTSEEIFSTHLKARAGPVGSIRDYESCL
jgi:hypothetical protein